MTTSIPANRAYSLLKAHALTCDERPRAALTERMSVGHGFCALLILDYSDMTKNSYASNSYAYGAYVTFPLSFAGIYNRIVKQAIAKHGRTNKASIAAMLNLLQCAGGTTLVRDDAVLTALAATLSTDEQAELAKALSLMGEPTDGTEVDDEKYRVLNVSALEDMNWPVALPDVSAGAHYTYLPKTAQVA